MEENKRRKREKKQLTVKQMVIRRVIFVIIFLIIAVGVTAYFIISKKSGNENVIDESNFSEEQVGQTSKNHQGLIDLENDTYDVNDLNVIFYDGEYEGLKYSYYQIDGLKDNSIEVSINYSLKNDIEKCIKEAIDNDQMNKDNFYCGIDFISNFANTLSISYNITSYNYDENTNDFEYLYDKYISENFDLTTGNRIEITDLFTDDTTGQMLFNSNFYSELIPSYTAQDFNEDEWYLKVSDYNDIEEEMADLINKFNNKREIAFTFDEQKVTLLGYYANIYYEDFVDYVAVYNKYKTNSTIFDGTYSKLKNLPIFAKRGDQEYQVIEKGDNYYIDISFSNITQAEWQNKVAFDAVVADIQAEIEELKEEASKTPSKFTIYNYTYGLSANTAWNGNDLEKVDDECTCTYTKLKYETTKSMFKSEIYDKIIKAFQSTQRDSIGEVYLYDNLFLYYVVDDSQNIITDYGDFNIDSNGLIYNYGTQEDDDNLLIWDIVD